MGRVNKERHSIDAGPSTSSPYAKPTAASAGDAAMMGRVRYVQQDGSKVKMGMVPPKSLGDLKKSAVSNLKLAGPELRLLHVRGPGQEVEIFDDLDYQTFLSRLSLPGSSTLTLKIVPSAASSTPNTSASSSNPPLTSSTMISTTIPKLKRKRSSSPAPPSSTSGPKVTSETREEEKSKSFKKRESKKARTESAGSVSEEDVLAVAQEVIPVPVTPQAPKERKAKKEKKEKRPREEDPAPATATAVTPLAVVAEGSASKKAKKRKRSSSSSFASPVPAPSPNTESQTSTPLTGPSKSAISLAPTPPPKKTVISLAPPGSAYKPVRPSPLAQSTVPASASPSSDATGKSKETSEDKAERKRLKKERKAAKAARKAKKAAEKLVEAGSVEVTIPAKTETVDVPGSPSSKKRRRNTPSSAASTPPPGPSSPSSEQGSGAVITVDKPKRESKKAKKEAKRAAAAVSDLPSTNVPETAPPSAKPQPIATAAAPQPTPKLNKAAAALAAYRAQQEAKASASTAPTTKETDAVNGNLKAPPTPAEARQTSVTPKKRKKEKQKEKAEATASATEPPQVLSSAPPPITVLPSAPGSKSKAKSVAAVPSKAAETIPTVAEVTTPVKAQPPKKASTPITALRIPVVPFAEEVEESVAPSTPTELSNSDSEENEDAQTPLTVNKGKGKAVTEDPEEEAEEIESDEDQQEPAEATIQAEVIQEDKDEELNSAASERYPSPESSIEAPISQRHKRRPGHLRTPTPEIGIDEDEDEGDEEDDEAVQVVGIRYDREPTPQIAALTEDKAAAGTNSDDDTATGGDSDTVDEEASENQEPQVPQEQDSSEAQEQLESAEVLVPATLPEVAAEYDTRTPANVPIVVEDQPTEEDETQEESPEIAKAVGSSGGGDAIDRMDEEEEPLTQVPDTPQDAQESLLPKLDPSSLLSPDEGESTKRKTFAELRGRSGSVIVTPDDRALDSSLPGTSADDIQSPVATQEEAFSPANGKSIPNPQTPKASRREVEVVIDVAGPESTPIASRTRRRTSASPAARETGPSPTVTASATRRMTRSSKTELPAISEDDQASVTLVMPKVLTKYDKPSLTATRVTRRSSRLSQEPPQEQIVLIQAPEQGDSDVDELASTIPDSAIPALDSPVQTPVQPAHQEEAQQVIRGRGRPPKAAQLSASALEPSTSTLPRPQSSAPAPAPLSRAPSSNGRLPPNKLQAARQASRTSCIICGKTPTHIQKRCPVVLQGLGTVKEKLEELSALKEAETDAAEKESIKNSLDALLVWEARMARSGHGSASAPPAASVKAGASLFEPPAEASADEDERGASASLETGEKSIDGEENQAKSPVQRNETMPEETEESDDDATFPPHPRANAIPKSSQRSTTGSQSAIQPTATQSQDWQKSSRTNGADKAAGQEGEDDGSDDDTSDTESESSDDSDSDSDSGNDFPPPPLRVLGTNGHPRATAPIRTLSNLSSSQGFTSLSDLPIEALKTRNGSTSSVGSPVGSASSRLLGRRAGKGREVDSDDESSDEESDTESSEDDEEEHADEEVRKRLVGGGKGRKSSTQPVKKGW